MNLFWFFTSREDKKIILSEIIKKLAISEEEKELYILSIWILSENDFNMFYNRIVEQVEAKPSTIIPFSNQLI